MGYSENCKGYKNYVVGQNEVEISHDVIFDEDIALRKINNLPILRNNKEVDTRNEGEKEEEMMLDIDEHMDPIDPPPHEPSSSKGDRHGLGRLSKMSSNTLHQGGISVKARSQTRIKNI